MTMEHVTIHGDGWKIEDVSDSIEWANTRVWVQQQRFALGPRPLPNLLVETV